MCAMMLNSIFRIIGLMLKNLHSLIYDLIVHCLQRILKMRCLRNLQKSVKPQIDHRLTEHGMRNYLTTCRRQIEPRRKVGLAREKDMTSRNLIT